MAIIIDWDAIPSNKAITRSELYNAIVSGYFSGSFSNPSKQAITKSVLTGTNINYDPNNSTLLFKSSNQILVKRDITVNQIKSYFNNSVLGLKIDSSDNIFCAGTFSSYNSYTVINGAKLSRNSSLDLSYYANMGSSITFFQCVEIQADGKIIFGGNITQINGLSKKGIFRTNVDGTIDTAFNSGTGFTSSSTLSINVIRMQSDGKIMVGGNFNGYDGSVRNRITRINSDGSVDSSFGIGSGFNSDVYAIAQQSDGKLLIGGSFTTYNGSPYSNIIRLNTDGSIDTSFNIGSGFSFNVGTGTQVRSISIQPDGKIIVSGFFDIYNGSSSRGVVRLNSNGTIDTSFNVGTGANSAVYGMKLQSDGKILITGDFTNYNGATQVGITRINSNGSRDTSFNVGSGLNSQGLAIDTLSDNKIIVAGNFTAFNGTSRGRIARLNSDGTLDTTF